MESINVFKGYGKVNPQLDLEDQTPHQQRTTTTSKSRIIILTSVLAILVLTLIVALMLAGLIHESNTEPPEDDDDLPSPYPSNPTESIKKVCAVTQYPASCFTSISSLNILPSTKPDPELIFKLSLHVSIKEIKNLSSLFTTLNEVNSQAAINDCVDQLNDALRRLNVSLMAMEVGTTGQKMLTLEKVNDIQTWISAAMTDEETCIDGLEEMGSSKVVDEVKVNMERSKQFLSNSLAIVAKMHKLLEKFNLKMH